jgi:hypothetical protein
MPKVSRIFSTVIFFVAGFLAMPMIALVLITVLVYAVLMTIGLIGPIIYIGGKKRRLGGLVLASMNQNIL